jgi:E-phenylitaconyl-CoA hydratase
MSLAIDFTMSDGVAVVTINRPERLNAMDAEHYSALSQAWTKVRDNPDIRVAVVTGAGEKSFTVGSPNATSCSTAAWRFGSR